MTDPERGARRIAMASDHAGFSLKEEIKQLLAGEAEIVDFGTKDEQACDLPDFVYPAALAVGRGEVDRGIFVDGVGYGSAMIANKIYGVYAAVCQDPFCASLARSHSNTNVLCLGGKIIGSALALEIVKTWWTTEFLADEAKYRRRVDKVTAISERHLRPLPLTSEEP
jgi:ribose 5-phosphate isomerase B